MTSGFEQQGQLRLTGFMRSAPRPHQVGVQLPREEKLEVQRGAPRPPERRTFDFKAPWAPARSAASAHRG